MPISTSLQLWTSIILVENVQQDIYPKKKILGHELMNGRLKLLLASSKSADCKIKLMSIYHSKNT